MTIASIAAYLVPAFLGAFAGWLLMAISRKQAQVANTRHDSETARESFAATDRVLNDPRTPRYLRTAILALLFGLRSERGAAQFFSPSAGSEDGSPGGSKLMEALGELRDVDPQLADDAQRAIVGLIVLMSSVYGESAREADEARDTAALYPSRLYARLQLPKSSDDDCLPLDTVRA